MQCSSCIMVTSQSSYCNNMPAGPQIWVNCSRWTNIQWLSSWLGICYIHSYVTRVKNIVGISGKEIHRLHKHHACIRVCLLTYVSWYVVSTNSTQTTSLLPLCKPKINGLALGVEMETSYMCTSCTIPCQGKAEWLRCMPASWMDGWLAGTQLHVETVWLSRAS